jgi:hypothetical protein
MTVNITKPQCWNVKHILFVSIRNHHALMFQKGGWLFFHQGATYTHDMEYSVGSWLLASKLFHTRCHLPPPDQHFIASSLGPQLPWCVLHQLNNNLLLLSHSHVSREVLVPYFVCPSCFSQLSKMWIIHQLLVSVILTMWQVLSYDKASSILLYHPGSTPLVSLSTLSLLFIVYLPSVSLPCTICLTSSFLML